MATALDLLMSEKEDVNLHSEESDICTIDAKTRDIFVPSTIVVGGVQSDKNAERIKFSCPKIVGDNLDLSKFSVRINFENVSSVDFNVSIKDQYICDDVAVDGENVTFSWLIGRNAARYMGTVRFIVCAVKTDSDSNISVEWNTAIAEVPVLKGIEIDQPQIGQEEKDVINQLLELTKNTSAEAVQNVNSAKEQAIKDIQSVSQPDTSLTIEGGLAEAKATGEAIDSLKEDIDAVNTIATNGEIVYFYQEHPKSNFYTENINLKANQNYTIYVKSSANCAVTIRDSADNRTEIVNVFGEETKEFTTQTNITGLILWINDDTTPTSQTFIVKIYRGKIKDEIKKSEKTKDIFVEKDGTGDFTNLVDAVNYVNSNATIKFTVYIGNGTYDLVEELGNDYFENFKGHGLILDNGAHYIFSSNSKVICNYTGSNSNIKKYFSPFNANSGKHKGFTLENLTLECSNVRYGIHDEGNGQSKPYSNKYLNCTIIHDNSKNSEGYLQCIGGGLGSACEIIIKDCFFQSIDAGENQIVTYHNGGNGKSNIVIEGCYFADKATCRCSYYGVATEKSKMMVSNCSMWSKPIKIQESPDYSVDNFELVDWNNEIRGN